MKDITRKIYNYKECVRNLWNIHFLKLISEEKDWEVKDEFDRICTKLFSVFVLEPLGLSQVRKSTSFEQYPEPINALQVVPNSKVSIKINRDVKCTGYWDYPINSIDIDEVELKFIDLFDFNQIEFRDFEYLRVRISNSLTKKELVGRDALIQCNQVKIFFHREV